MSISTRRPIIGPPPLSPEWRDVRRRVVSATAVARIMVGDGFPVYCEMHGDTEAFSGNAITQDGNDLQRGVLSMYARRAKAVVMDPVPFLIDGECDSLGATPDGIAIPCTEPDGIPKIVGSEYIQSFLGAPESWCVEAKTTTSPAIARQLGEEESDELPERWIWQGQVQASVTGAPYVDFPVLLFGRIRIFKMQRNETLVAKCREVAEDMTARVRDGRPPEVNYSSPADQEAIRSLYGVTEERTVALSHEAVAAWDEYKRLGVEYSRIEKERKAMQTRVLAEMGDAAIGLVGGVPFLKRKIVTKESYVVKATSYPQLTAIKTK